MYNLCVGFLCVQSAMRELIDSGRYDTHDNFTVVLQPFFREIFLPKLQVKTIRFGSLSCLVFLASFLFSFTVFLTASFLKDGRPDRSYFSPDCFHLSQKAHTLMARSLWNNMVRFAPVGDISLIFYLILN